LKKIIEFFESLKTDFLQDPIFDQTPWKNNFYMDIYRHKDTLLKWICSCQTAQQLDVFTRLVTEFEVTRFHDKIEPLEIELAKKELYDAIIDQRVIIAGKREPMRLTSHYLIIPYEQAICLS
jgi:hypothetical protein